MTTNCYFGCFLLKKLAKTGNISYICSEKPIKNMTKMKNKLDFSQIPPSWDYCFNNHCTKCEECLRYHSGSEIPDDRQRGHAIFPNAVQEDGCPFFRADEPVQMATGFINENNPAMRQAFISLRHDIENITGGGGSYYLYRNGSKWLTPKQQEQMRKLFVDAGYPEPTYDRYKYSYDFS